MLRITRWGVGVLLLSASAVLLAGCGVSDYNSLARKRVALMRGEVKFRGLYQPTQIPDTQLSVRIPMIFSDSYTQQSPHRDDGDVIRPDRLQPPFLPLPGLKLCYENKADSPDGQKLPFYCYIAAVPSQPGQAEKYAGELQAALKRTFPDSAEAWETIDADSPTGFAVHWQKLRAEGPQPFIVKNGDKSVATPMPGIFELWMHDAGDQLVLIGWRTPTSINQTNSEPVQVEAGVVVPPSDPKPDIDKWPALTAGTLTKQEPAE